MNRLDKLSTRSLIRLWIEAENHKQLSYFQSLNPKGGHYTQEQKEYAIEKAATLGARATSRLLHVPRKTIQRWLRSEGIVVKRYPDWVYDWAYWKRKKREKWERIMLFRKWRHLKMECLKKNTDFKNLQSLFWIKYRPPVIFCLFKGNRIVFHFVFLSVLQL